MVKNFLDYYQAVNKRKRKTNEEKEYTKHLQYVKNKSYSDNKSEYDQARKDLGYSADDMLTKRKYDSYVGNEKTGDKGIAGRMQEYYAKHPDRKPVQQELNKPYKSSTELKVNHNEKKAAEKSGSSLQNILSEIKNNKVAKGYLNALGKEVKGISSYLEQKYKPQIKAGKLGVETEDRFIAAPTRNVTSSAIDKKFQPGKDISEAWKNEKRTSGEEIMKQLGVKNKVGQKIGGITAEALLDPANLVGAGVGGKMLKATSKLAKFGKEANIIEKVAKNGVKKGEAKNVLKAIKKLSEQKKTEQLPTQETAPVEQMKKLLTRTNQKGKFVSPNKEIEPIKPAANEPNFMKQKEELEFIRQADKEQFAKENAKTIQAITETRHEMLKRQMEEEAAFEGHTNMAKQYDEIMKSVGGRLNIPESNHSDFATQLGKHMYSAKGKGKGDDIYKVAEDLGFNNPDELIQHLNNGYTSKQVVKAGKNKFMKVQQVENPDTVLEELYSESKNGSQLNQDIQKLEKLHQESLKAAPGKMAENISPRNEFENISPEGMNPIDAPLIEQRLPVNHDIPYKKGDQLPDTKGHIISKTERNLREMLPTKNSVIMKTVDDLHPLKEIDKTIEKIENRRLKGDESLYTKGLNSRGVDMTAHEIATEGLVNKRGEKIGNSLKEALSGIPKGKMKEFNDYLTHNHAVTRQNRGEKVFPEHMEMNALKSEAKVKEYDKLHPEFKEVAKKFYNFNKQFMQTWAVDEGLITQKQLDTMLEENPFYVPMNRYFSKLEKAKGGFKRASNKFSNQSAGIKKVSPAGSERPIIDPIESTIENMDRIVKASKRNEVTQTLIKHFKKNDGFIEGIGRIVPEKELTLKQKTDLNGHIDEHLDQFENQFERTALKSHDNMVFGMVDGKKTYIQLHDPDYLTAISNLEPIARDIVTNTVGKVTHAMKVLITGNPVFAITKNVWKDIPQAYANSSTTHNPLTFSKDIFTSMWDVMKDTKVHKEYKAIGGGHSSAIASDRNMLRQTKDEVLQNKNFQTTVRKIYNNLGENFTNAIETAPRLAEYKRVMKEYDKLKMNPSAKTKIVQPGESKYGAQQKGLFEANDITVNFKKRGTYTKAADGVIPYLNAAIQGLDKLGRQFAKNPISTTAKATASVSIPSAILYSVNRENPNYQQLSDHVKDNYMCIPINEHGVPTLDNKAEKFLKIPVPRELGVLFHSGLERVMRKTFDDDPEAFKHFSDTIFSAFLPPVRSTFAAVNDVRANKDFQGAPIVPGSLMNNSPEYQYDSRTTEPAKLLGKITNYSPKKIDYLAKSYLGVLAQVGQPATTEATTVGDTYKNLFVADPVFSNDYQRDFYEKKTELDQKHFDENQGAPKLDPQLDSLRKKLGKNSKAMGDVRKDIKKVIEDKTLSKKEKERKTRELQQKINMLANLKNLNK